MNKKYSKVGLLVFILVIPAFLFLMAHLLGENHFGLPKYFPIGVQSDTIEGKLQVDSVYHQIGSVTGMDENGTSFSTEEYKGNIIVYAAFFTNCNTICPLINSNLCKVNSAYLQDTSIALISLSVDPEQDVPTVLKEYKQLFDIKNDRWKFLQVFPKQKVYEFLTTELYLSGGENESTKDVFFHSENVVLVDRNGVIRGYFDATNAEKIDELIGAIKILKSEDEREL